MSAKSRCEEISRKLIPFDKQFNEYAIGMFVAFTFSRVIWPAQLSSG